jgi:DNA-binding NtrC family response regulator
MPLEQTVAEGRFRQDLYYRLSVILIRVPPLRERRADIPLLIASVLEDACRRAGQRKTLSAEALEALMRHQWLGNVRELRNTIERLVASSRGSTLEAFDLPHGARPASQRARTAVCRSSDARRPRAPLPLISRRLRTIERAPLKFSACRRTLYEWRSDRIDLKE